MLDGTAASLEPSDQPRSPGVDVPGVAATTRDPDRARASSVTPTKAGREGPLAAGIDAALVRDLLIEVAVIADNALRTAPTVPEG